jgi:hypothetical protein
MMVNNSTNNNKTNHYPLPPPSTRTINHWTPKILQYNGNPGPEWGHAQKCGKIKGESKEIFCQRETIWIQKQQQYKQKIGSKQIL